MLENTTSAALSSWGAECSALVADALRRSGSLRLRVRGESMLPALWPGEVVEIANCSVEDMQPGEIGLALRDGRLFLHRFVGSSTPNGFRLRGDSMPCSDPPFPSEALLGRLVRDRIRNQEGGRAISVAALSRAVGLLLCYCRVARRLALKLHSHRTSAQKFRRLGAL